MPSVYTPGVIKVALNFVGNGQPMANTIHVAVDGVVLPTAADVQLAATTCANWVVADYQAGQSIDVQFVNATATSVAEPSGPQFITSPGTPEYGDVSVPSLPNNVTFAIKFSTGLSGRSFRGRFYWIGMCESFVTGNQVIAGTAATFVDIMEQLPVALATNNMTHVVVSTISGGVQRPDGIATPVIGYSYTDLTVDTQRKRLS